MNSRLTLGLLSMSAFLFSATSSAFAQTAFDQMIKAAEAPRIEWRPNCGTIESNLGPLIVGTTKKDVECMKACVENRDGENFRAYQYYCLESYDAEQCLEAIRRLGVDDTCRLECCEALQHLRN